MIDTSLIRQCVQREPKSLELCYRRCAPYVYTIIKSYVKDAASHKDVMQNTFIQIYQSLGNFDDAKGPFKAWVATITTRQCIKHLKDSKKLNLFVPYETDQGPVSAEDAEKLDRLSDAEIELLLMDMPEGYKAVFLMAVIDGFSHGEIAEQLSITPETSRSQLSRSIKWIKANILHETKNYIYGKY